VRLLRRTVSAQEKRPPNYAYRVQQEFERLLAAAGRSLDAVGQEAWMPRETRYRKLVHRSLRPCASGGTRSGVIVQSAQCPREECGSGHSVPCVWAHAAVHGASQQIWPRPGSILAMNAIELKRRAQRKLAQIEKRRRGPRYRRVLGRFVQEGLLFTTEAIERHTDPFHVEEVLG